MLPPQQVDRRRRRGVAGHHHHVASVRDQRFGVRLREARDLLRRGARDAARDLLQRACAEIYRGARAFLEDFRPAPRRF